MIATATARTRPQLATWLFASVMGCAMAAVLACTALIDGFVRHEERADALRFLQTHADALRDALDRGMALHYEEVRIIGQLDQVARGGDVQATRRALEQVRASFPQFAWLGLTDRQGKVLAAVDGLLEGQDVSGRPWFAGALKGPHVGDVHAAKLLEKLMPVRAEPWRFVDIAVPVLGADGQRAGVLGAHLSWSWAVELQHSLVDRALMAQQAQAYVLAADGKVLLGPPATLGKPLPAAAAGELQVLARTQGFGRYPGLGWQVAMRQPESMAMAAFDTLQRRILLAPLLLGALLAWPIWLLARRLARPLDELTARLNDGADPGVPLQRPLYHEAELLGDALERHARRQASDATQLRELNAELESRVTQRTEALARSNAELQTAIEERIHSEHRLRDITDNVPALIAYFDIDERCRFANAQVRRFHRLSPRQIPGITLREALGERYAEHQPHIEAVKQGKPSSLDGRVQAGAQQFDFRSHFVPDLDAQGAVVGFYVLSHDQTALMAAERRSAEGERWLRNITDNVPVLIAYIDRAERYRFCNGTYRDWLGLEPTELIGQTVAQVLSQKDYALRQPLLARGLAGERVDCAVESTWLGVHRHLHLTYLPDLAADGTVDGVYALITDVSAMKAAEQALAALADTDSLTGLPNRRGFNDALTQSLARCRRTRRAMALLFLDIDKFKAINDGFGHAVGDQVLTIFAARLRGSVRETDTVARLAGDEFVVLLEGLRSPHEAELVASSILASIGRPFHVSAEAVQRTLDITTSIGITFETRGNTEPARLLDNADKALYEAKNAGRNTFRATRFEAAAEPVSA